MGIIWDEGVIWDPALFSATRVCSDNLAFYSIFWDSNKTVTVLKSTAYSLRTSLSLIICHPAIQYKHQGYTYMQLSIHHRDTGIWASIYHRDTGIRGITINISQGIRDITINISQGIRDITVNISQHHALYHRDTGIRSITLEIQASCTISKGYNHQIHLHLHQRDTTTRILYHTQGFHRICSLGSHGKRYRSGNVRVHESSP